MMKRLSLTTFMLTCVSVFLSLTVKAEDGHQLWLRYQPVNKAKVTADHESPTVSIAKKELATYYRGESISLRLDSSMPDDDGFPISGNTISARRDVGLLLWFHHVPWDYRMRDGSTLWESMQYHYRRGVITVEQHQNLWHTKMRHFIDEQRWREVDQRLEEQVENAREWCDVCLRYFGQFAEPLRARAQK